MHVIFNTLIFRPLSYTKAPKGPTIGAEIPGHALHVLKTWVYFLIGMSVGFGDV